MAAKNVTKPTVANPATTLGVLHLALVIAAASDVLLFFLDAVATVVFLRLYVGNICGVADTWNCGFIGLPSYENRWSLYPSVGSVKMRQDVISSVSLYVSMKFETAAQESWICWKPSPKGVRTMEPLETRS